MASDRCLKVKDSPVTRPGTCNAGSLPVPHEGSAADFDNIMADLIKHGRIRRV